MWLLLFLCALRGALGKNATEIPRAGSKVSPDAADCGLPTLPEPVLTECSEPIPEGVPDHSGIWESTSPSGGWQRIEQCGLRYTVSGPGSDGRYYVHDFVQADGTSENGCNDFNAAQFPACTPVNPAGVFESNCMNMKVGAMTGATRCLINATHLEFFNVMLGTDLLLKVDKPPSPAASTTPDVTTSSTTLSTQQTPSTSAASSQAAAAVTLLASLLGSLQP
eukprot:TRINITY_DN92689_c0_g1_i1.p1 TRINITY_DN92689_c0_g1~~TRINITY_DN92689_c0_g1_i1.p1  ORF type:complete len:222 (-),score=43.74 TRINITY_DN92689_c0_g1_i1:128-793(-)